MAKGFHVLAVLLGLAGAGQARDHLIVATAPPDQPDIRLAAQLLARMGPPARQITPAQLAGQPPTALRVIYYTGAVTQNREGLALPGTAGSSDAGAVGLGDYLRSQTGRTVLLLNLCGHQTSAPGSPVAAEGDWLIVTPAPARDCKAEEFAQVALDALNAPPEKWLPNLRMAGLQVAAPTHAPTSIPPPDLQRVQDDVIVVSALGRGQEGPVIMAQDLIPAPSPSPSPVVPPTGPVPQDDARDQQAHPPRPGYPQPSVIVGYPAIPPPAQPDPALNVTPLGVVHDQRARLRQQDPASFTRLLQAGGLDPAPDRIAEAIQTELSRMGCYSGQIDGLWGGASINAVQRYFAKAGGQAVVEIAETALYRQIISGDEVICDPAPTVATPASSARSGNTLARPGATTGARPAATRPSPPASPAPQPLISPNFGGTGLFR